MSSQPEVVVGKPKARVDARLKVTGKAPYAADHGREHGIEKHGVRGHGRRHDRPRQGHRDRHLSRGSP